MGYQKYVQALWQQPRENLKESYRTRLVEWRRQHSIERVEHPTRIDRARRLGYRAKQGFVIARVRVKRGGKNNATIKRGRDGGNLTTRIAQSKNYQWIAEERVQKKFPNLEVLNSYWVGQDEKSIWHEVILVDVYHPQIVNDETINWIVSNKHTRRVHRGLTSAGKRSRGLRSKGLGAEKVRPGVRAHGRRLR
ncbi:MAG: 50S ribosomal protein L15e [Nanoarchaeota archaeon]|nr:50S ribosomal protein L15e [Nanoarchaeota archaeon]